MFADDAVNLIVTWTVLTAVLAVGIGLWVPLRMCAAGKLGPNSFIGWRTRSTTRSQEAWQYAHRAGMIYGQALPWIAVVFGLGGMAVWAMTNALVAQTIGFLGVVSILFVMLMGQVFASAASKDIK